jgi:TonB family protein
VDAFNQRQGFLVSAIVHLLIMMVLVSRPAPRKAAPETESLSPKERRQAVFLPPPEVLKQLVPMPAPRPTPVVPRPAPTPPPAGKDRISIGPPSSERAKGPLLLRKEDDLTKVPKGQPSVAPPVSPSEAQAARAGGAPETTGTEGLRLPPGLIGSQQAANGSKGRPGPPGPSIASSLQNLDRHLQEAGQLGLPTGTGQQMGPLFFDPQGADFTLWIQRFKEEVYHNWIAPQPALLGMRGHVDFEMTVERDGSISDLKVLKSAGNQALDRAARNALLGSRLLPLPADYRPPRVTMQVTFFYNEQPQGS